MKAVAPVWTAASEVWISFVMALVGIIPTILSRPLEISPTIDPMKAAVVMVTISVEW